MWGENLWVGLGSTGWAGRWALRAAVLALALGTAPACWAQLRSTSAPATGRPADVSIAGNARNTKCRPPRVLPWRTGVPRSRHAPMAYNSPGNRAPQTPKGSAMTDYLIAAVLFVAIVTTLVYLWKRERG